MKVLISLLLLWCLVQSNHVQGKAFLSGSNVAQSFNSIVSGIGKQIPNLIPTPQELFHASKQILFGLPEVAIFKTINKLCSVYLASDTINPRVTPDMDSITFRLRTPCEELSFPLTDAGQILESPEFDVTKNVAIFVTGWMSGSEADYVTDMAQAYHCRGDYNFLALNSSNAIDTLYTWSAFNTEEIGRQVALALEKLVEKVPVENIHLIGHSLGAHIVGYAGRYFNEITGQTIPRITGLDPANPCFNEGESLSGLQRGDASFIDVIHTNPGVLGKSNSVGDADFFVEGLDPIKPGCKMFGCSHSRAYEYYTESVYPGNEENFLATRCNSISKIRDGFCSGAKNPMGFAVPFNLKGNYYLSVNAKKPFGKNANSDNEASAQCGRCDSESDEN